MEGLLAVHGDVTRSQEAPVIVLALLQASKVILVIILPDCIGFLISDVE